MHINMDSIFIFYLKFYTLTENMKIVVLQWRLWIMIMQNHGLLAVGRSVAEAFYNLYTVENACKVQVDVLASGKEVVTPRQDAIDTMAKMGLSPTEPPYIHVNMAWEAVVRLLDQKDPSYRN